MTKKRKGRDTLIYFIQDNGNFLVKIGFTGDSVKSRRKAGETWCPYGTTVLASIPGDISREKALHRRFAASRVSPSKEWFRASPEIIAFLLSQTAIPGGIQLGMNAQKKLNDGTTQLELF